MLLVLGKEGVCLLPNLNSVLGLESQTLQDKELLCDEVLRESHEFVLKVA